MPRAIARCRAWLPAGALLCASGATAGDPTGVDDVAVKASDAGPAVEEVETGRFTWVVTPVSVPRGGREDLLVQLMLPADFEVFRNDIHLTVIDDAGLRVGEPVLPEGRMVEKGDGGPAVEAYDHDVSIFLPVRAGRVVPGLREIQIEAEVRGCSGRRCLAGRKETLAALVHVVAE